ncbi:MAG: glycosyltransferase family protein, partial [Planctomycetota bacterium]
MQENSSKTAKPIDKPQHISVLMPTRARLEYLDRSLASIDCTVGNPSGIDTWIYVDNDDDITKKYISSGSYLRFSFKINWVLGERTISQGQMVNILRQRCTTNPGIYIFWPDDYIFTSNNWDSAIRDTFNRYPDRIVLGHIPDPLLNYSDQLTIAALSAEWTNVTGKLLTEFFPFWNDDTWLDHVSQLVQRKVRVDDVSVEPIGGKGETQRLKNLPFWDRFFNNLMDERIKEANLLREAMYPKDSPEYEESLEEAERLARALTEKREKKTIDSLLAMERACSSFPEKPQPHLITLYLVLETRAVSRLCGKVDSLMQAGDFDKTLKMLDNVLLAEQEYKNINYLRAVCLNHLGRTGEAVQAARKELNLQPEHKVSLEIIERQPTLLPEEALLRGQSRRLNDAAQSTSSQNITWEQVKQMPAIRLYAGDVPAQKEYEGVVGLSLTHNDHNHIRHDITKPFPLADNTIDSFQAEDVFEHIQYERLLPIVNEIYRVLKPGGLFRLSVPDYGCDVLHSRCKKNEQGRILFDPGGGGTPDDPGHVWFPKIDRVRQLLEQTKFHESETIEFLHYYDMDGTFITKPIDYTKGHVTRTPDFDERVRNPYRPMSLVVDLTKPTPLHLQIVEPDGENALRTCEKCAEDDSLQYPSFNALVSLLSSRNNYRPTIISTAEVFCGPDCQTTMDAGKYRTIKSPAGVYDIEQIVKLLPPSQTPQLVVIKADATGRNFPINLQKLKCPRLLILGNTQHLKTPIRALLNYALQEKFDFIMSDHKRHHLHYFKEIGFEKVFWLPAFNISPHKQPYYEDKRYEVSFVGQAGKWHPYRKYILQLLKANGVPVNHFQIPPVEAAQIYAQSLVNLNVSLNGDLNLRVFEVLSSGGFLLTDKLTMESGLELLFKDGQHLVCFENEHDLLDKIRYFLKHPDEAKAIAQNGYEEFERNHTPEKKTKELSDYIFNGELDSLYDIRKDKRSIYVKTDSQTELIQRVALYEFFQELHLRITSTSVLLWPNVDGRLACDVLDLPRLRLFIKNDSDQIPDQNIRLFQNTDMVERIKLVTTEQLQQMNLFWNVLVITASELLTAGLKNLLTSMKFKWLVISDGFDALDEQQKKEFTDILAAAGFEKSSEGLELYYWKDKNLWGEILYSENKIGEAISCFGQALLENPSHCDALNNLGVISCQLEQLENAEKLLLKAVRLNRRNLNALTNLSHLYLRIKRFDDAAELFQEAISLNREDPSLWFHLGSCYEQSNRNPEALEAYKRCNELG